MEAKQEIINKVSIIGEFQSSYVYEQELYEEVRRTLGREVEALSSVIERLDKSIIDAIKIILNSNGKVVCTGVGKSGIVARKVAATFCSTGSPAVFMNASEASHGDLGILQEGEPVILFSNSGSTAELLNIIPTLHRFSCQLIGILGNKHSPMAAQIEVVIDASVSREADCLNLAPTASTLVAMAIGDALASALMLARDFSYDQYLTFHPGGQLGRSLSLNVESVMRRRNDIPTVKLNTTLLEVLEEISRKRLGAACVIDHVKRLKGIITDGDVRRYLQDHDDFREVTAIELMNTNPVTLKPGMLLKDAVKVMRKPLTPLSIVPVVSESHMLLGVVWYFDVAGRTWMEKNDVS